MVCLSKNNLLYFIQHTISKHFNKKYLYYKLMNKHFVIEFWTVRLMKLFFQSNLRLASALREMNMFGNKSLEARHCVSTWLHCIHLFCTSKPLKKKRRKTCCLLSLSPSLLLTPTTLGAKQRGLVNKSHTWTFFGSVACLFAWGCFTHLTRFGELIPNISKMCRKQLLAVVYATATCITVVGNVQFLLLLDWAKYSRFSAVLTARKWADLHVFKQRMGGNVQNVLFRV